MVAHANNILAIFRPNKAQESYWRLSMCGTERLSALIHKGS